MRFPGRRRVRLITAGVVAFLLIAIWRATVSYVDYVRASLGPEIVHRVEDALQRSVTVEALDYSRPGHAVLRGVLVRATKDPKSPPYFRAAKLELTYAPELIRWQNLIRFGVGVSTAARVRGYELRLFDPERPGVGAVISSRKLAADFDLGPLLRGSTDILPTVPLVTLDENVIRVSRSASGEWSLARLFKRKPKQPTVTFKGEIIARKTTLELVDYRSGALPAPVRNVVRGDVAAHFAGSPVVRLEVRGKSDAEHTGPFRVSGHRDIKDGAWMASVQAQVSDFRYWFRYLAGKTAAVDIRQGAGAVDVVAWGGPKHRQTMYQMSMQVRDGALKLPSVREPFTQVSGKLGLDAQVLSLRGEATAAGIPVAVDGEMRFGVTPSIHLNVTTDRATLPAAQRLLPALRIPDGVRVRGAGPLRAAARLEGKIWHYSGETTLPAVEYGEAVARTVKMRFNGVLTGNPSRDLVSGDFVPQDLRWRNTVATRSAAEFRLRNQVVQVNASMQVLGGFATGQGWVQLGGKEPRYYATGAAAGIDIAQVTEATRSDEAVGERKPDEKPAARPWKVAGLANGEFIVHGSGQRPVVSAYVRAPTVTVNRESAGPLSARVRYAAGEEAQGLTIQYATLEDSRLRASATGRIGPKGELNLRLSAPSVDLAGLLEGRVKDKITGSATLAAAVTGTLEAPNVEASFQVYRPTYRTFGADYAEGRVATSAPDDVQLTSLKLIHAPEVVQADRIHFTRATTQAADGTESAVWRVDGSLTLENLSLGRTLRLAGVDLEQLRGMPIAGELKPVKLTLSGEVGAPHITFEAEGDRTVFLGFDLGRIAAAGSFDWPTGQVKLDRVTAESERLQVSADGVIGLDPAALKTFTEPAAAPDPSAPGKWDTTTIDLQVAGTRVPLMAMVGRFAPAALDYVTLDAEVEGIDGRLSGTVGEPRGRFDIRWGDVLANNRAITVAPTTIDWSPDAVLVRDAAARIGSGRLKAPHLGVWLSAPPNTPLVERLAGSVDLEAFPVSVVRQLIEDSPYFPTEEGKGLREVFSLWTTAIAGDIELGLSVPMGEGVPQTPAEFAARMAMPRTAPPRLVGRLLIPDLASPPGPNSPVYRIASNFAYDRTGLALTTFSAEGGGSRLEVSGRANALAKNEIGLDLTAAIRNLSLESIARTPLRSVRAVFEPLLPVDGELRAEGTVTGTAAAPIARFTLDVEKPVLAGMPFDALRVRGAELLLGPGTLALAEASLVRERDGADDARVTAAGILPLPWRANKDATPAPRNFALDIPKQPLAMFGELAEDAEKYAEPRDPEVRARLQPLLATLRQVAATAGSMEAHIKLTGTSAAPLDSGEARLSDATLRLVNFQTEIRDFNALAQLDNGTVTIKELAGQGSLGGSLAGGGTIRLANAQRRHAELDLSLTANQFKFVEKKLSSMAADRFRGAQYAGTIQTVDPSQPLTPAPLRLKGPTDNAELSGAARLDDATLALLVEWGGQGDWQPAPFDVDLNLQLIAGKKVWLQNPQVGLRLENTLHVSQSLRNPKVAGELTASDGSFTLPTMRLRDVEGRIKVDYEPNATAFGKIQRPPVDVDLRGTTQARIQRTPTSETEDYELTVEIRGSPGPPPALAGAGVTTAALDGGAGSGLRVTVYSDPPLPSREIEALIRQQLGAQGFSLTGANVVEALRSQIEQALSVNVTYAITRPIEEALQNALGLDIVSFELGVSEQPVRLRVGKRLFGQLYGTFSHDVGREDGRERRMELYYRVTPRFRIGIRDEQPLGRQTIFFSGTASF